MIINKREVKMPAKPVKNTKVTPTTKPTAGKMTAKPMAAATAGVPVLVKVIAVLYYIGAALALIGGVAMIFGSAALGTYMSAAIPGGEALGVLGAGLFIVVGIILIAFAVLDFFVGRGLWKAKKWARIVAIIIAILGVISAITSFAWVSLVIHALIGGYLIFSKGVKAAFA